MRAENLLFAQALRQPGKTALICGDERISYAELVSRIKSLAGSLLRLGVMEGDRVLFCLPNGVEIVELIYAVYSLGAIIVPVTTRLTANEIAYICEDSKPSAIVFEGDGAHLKTVLANVDSVCISVGGGASEAHSFETMRDGEVLPLPRLRPGNDDAVIMYTSGTTGKPKGAIITHANVVVQHTFLQGLEWGLSDQDRFIVVTPIAHRTAFARLSNAMSLGGVLIIMKKFDARQTVSVVEREGVTVAGMVPTVCRMLLPEIAADPARCKSLRTVIVTGEAFPVDLKRKLIDLLPSVKLISLFAMTEVGGVTSLSHKEQFTHAASVGRPSLGVEVRVVNDEGADLLAGEAGELLVRVGEPGRFSVMRGYYNRPQETEKAIKDGWLHTGDVAKIDGDGYLYIVDRKKDMVKSGGFNIYTKEVEQALISHPDVVDASVIGVPDPIYGESVVAFVESRADVQLGEVAMLDHVRPLIAGYKKPKYIIFVDALPRNSLGKVLKGELREKVGALIEDRAPAKAM
jgi:long-chain acyl-CoA synthetase